jgi:hypothetical protein
MIRGASAVLFVLLTVGCSSAPPVSYLPVSAASPPKDDGSASKGGNGGSEHAAALEQLKTAKVEARPDKQNSVRIPLPDGANWTRVKFWGVPSLVGFRYGKDHHAIVGGWVIEADDNTSEGACTKNFEKLAKPVVDAFDVDLEHEPPSAFTWKFRTDPTVHVVAVDAVFARTATLAARDRYAGAYAAYPVWKNRCFVLGVAVPVREEEARARQVRDRFVQDVFPKVEVLASEEPKERY